MPLVIFIGVIVAPLLWLLGRRRRSLTGLPGRQILSAYVRAEFPQSRSITSERSGLTGKPDYVVRVLEGVVPVEIKSGTVRDPVARMTPTRTRSQPTACRSQKRSKPMSLMVSSGTWKRSVCLERAVGRLLAWRLPPLAHPRCSNKCSLWRYELVRDVGCISVVVSTKP